MKILQNSIVQWAIVGLFVVVAFIVQRYGFGDVFGRVLSGILFLLSTGLLIKGTMNFQKIKKAHFASFLLGVVILLFYAGSYFFNTSSHLSNLDSAILVTALISIMPAAADMTPQYAELYRQAREAMKDIRKIFLWLAIIGLILGLLFLLWFFLIASPYYPIRFQGS